MSVNKYTKAELLEMLSSKGIDAKPSMKKDELIELLGNTVEPNKGVGVRLLAALAGHSHISTTQRYIDVNSDQLSEAVELLQKSGLSGPSGKVQRMAAQSPRRSMQFLAACARNTSFFCTRARILLATMWRVPLSMQTAENCKPRIHNLTPKAAQQQRSLQIARGESQVTARFKHARLSTQKFLLSQF